MTEYTLSCQVARILETAGLLYTHVPSETPDIVRASQNSVMGVSRGVPDFLVFTAPPLAIELKLPAGRVSVAQQRWLDALRAEGWRAEVCRSVDEVMAVLREQYGSRLYQ